MNTIQEIRKAVTDLYNAENFSFYHSLNEEQKRKFKNELESKNNIFTLALGIINLFRKASL